MSQIKKVVLAYSGGLDTSIILRWLQETYGCEVVTFTADIGNHMLFATRHLVLAGPDEFRMSQGLGGMGSGIGLAIVKHIAQAHGGDATVLPTPGGGTKFRVRIPVETVPDAEGA